jgi:hypothetical protein
MNYNPPKNKKPIQHKRKYNLPKIAKKKPSPIEIKPLQQKTGNFKRKSN